MLSENFAPEQLIALLDLTSLNDADTAASIQTVCQKALTPYGHVAAVCIYPRFVRQAVAALRGTAVAVATVANFPEGCGALEVVKQTITQAIADGAEEIDVVFPYRAHLAQRYSQALEFISNCRECCGDDILLKVILETGVLAQSDIIARAAELAIEGGADFIKSSTGKTAIGITADAAQAMLHVIKQYSAKKIGFKISGGVRHINEAMYYVALTEKIVGAAWISPKTFRIGASQLLDNILKPVRK